MTEFQVNIQLSALILCEKNQKITLDNFQHLQYTVALKTAVNGQLLALLNPKTAVNRKISALIPTQSMDQINGSYFLNLLRSAESYQHLSHFLPRIYEYLHARTY
jgi:hypothetical protein